MNQALEFAREFVRDRIERCAPQRPVELVPKRRPRTAELSQRAQVLVDALQRETGVKWAHAPEEQTLRDLLSFSRDSLPPSLVRDWERIGLEESCETFVYDVLHVLERVSTSSKWREAIERLPRQPRNEEELLDLLMSMSWGDFLDWGVQLVPESPS